MYEKKTSRNWVQSLGKNLTWRSSNSCIYHSISYNVSFINHPPHNLAIPVFLCLETQSLTCLPCLRAWPWESRVFKAITMEFLRQVSVLFFIVGIFCDDGLVISSLLIYLENRIYIFLSCAFHIYTGFLSFFLQGTWHRISKSFRERPTKWRHYFTSNILLYQYFF